MPAALGQEVAQLPPHLKDVITRARTSWLKNIEVRDILQHHRTYRLPVGAEAPYCPGGGYLFLFNRKRVRFFRKDGHEWRKKADGKTVRETHEKLKIDNKDALNCYYAQAEAREALQRRCYWLLDGESDIVLVHYLSSDPASRTAAAASSSTLTSTAARESSSNLRAAPHDSTCAGGSLGRSCPSGLGAESRQPALTITTGESIRRPLDPLDCSAAAAAGHKILAQQVAKHSAEPEAIEGGTGVGTAKAPACFVSMPPADTADRANSIGPLHSAPSFSGGTVQTGPTLAVLQQQSVRQDSRHSSQSGFSETGMPLESGGCRSLDAVASSFRPACNGRRRPASASIEPWSAPRLSGTIEPESIVRRDSGAADGGHFELKPAMSLTRVDSDTLKVAPSLSRATSGAPNPAARYPGGLYPTGMQEAIAERPSLPSSVFSPFYAAAFCGSPIGSAPPVTSSASQSLAQQLEGPACTLARSKQPLFSPSLTQQEPPLSAFAADYLGLQRSKRPRQEYTLETVFAPPEPSPFSAAQGHECCDFSPSTGTAPPTCPAECPQTFDRFLFSWLG